MDPPSEGRMPGKRAAEPEEAVEALPPSGGRRARRELASASRAWSSQMELRWWKGVCGRFCCFSAFSGLSPVLCLVAGWPGVWPAAGGCPGVVPALAFRFLCLKNQKTLRKGYRCTI